MGSKPVSVRVPDNLLSAISQNGLEHYPKGDSFDLSATILALLAKGLGIETEPSPATLETVLRRLEVVEQALSDNGKHYVNTDYIDARIDRLDGITSELLTRIDVVEENQKALAESHHDEEEAPVEEEGVTAASIRDFKKNNSSKTIREGA